MALWVRGELLILLFTQGNSHSWSQSRVALSPLDQQLDWFPLAESVSGGKDTIFLAFDHVMWHFITSLDAIFNLTWSSNCKEKQIEYFSDYSCKTINVKQPGIGKWYITIRKGEQSPSKTNTQLSTIPSEQLFGARFGKAFFQSGRCQNTPALLKDGVPK